MPRDASGKLLLADTDYLDTWKGIEECKNQGLVRSIGVSNFNSEQITRLLDAAKIKPVNNQVKSIVRLIKEKENILSISLYIAILLLILIFLLRW